MSMNTFRKNMTQSVDDIKTSISQTETDISALQKTTNESLVSLSSEISTLESDTGALISTKENKLSILSQLSVNTIKLNDMKLGDKWLKIQLLVMNDAINNKQDKGEGNEYIDNEILSAIAESNAYTDSELFSSKANTKQYIASELATAQMEVQNIINPFTDRKLATNKTESEAYTDSKVATSKAESNTYTDSKVATSKAESVDYANYISTMHKTQSQTYTDIKVSENQSAISINTIDSSDFSMFATSAPGYTTTKIAQFFFTPNNANSRFNCFFNVPYYFPSGGAHGFDKMSAYAKISQQDSWPYFVQKYQSYSATQFYVGGGGGGTRSGVMFPLQFSIKPNILSGVQVIIEIFVQNDCDDEIRLDRNEGCWLTCNEIKTLDVII